MEETKSPTTNLRPDSLMAVTPQWNMEKLRQLSLADLIALKNNYNEIPSMYQTLQDICAEKTRQLFL